MKCKLFVKAYFVCLLPFLLFGLVTGQTHGQWTTQSVSLAKGWNAVYIIVSPGDRCDQLFTGKTVSVYQYNSSLNAQYTTSPSQPLPRDAEWLTWHSGSSNALPPTLFSLRAGQGYLISNDVPFTLVLTGRVETIHRTWHPDDWHLTGFDMMPGTGMTFAQYFGPALDHVDELQRVDSDGISRDIASSTVMEPGRAYWIKTKGNLDFDGPIAIDGGVWLNAADATSTLTVSNRSSSVTNTLTFTLTHSLLSEAVPLMRWIESEQVYRSVAANVPFSLTLAPSSAMQLVFKADATGLQAGQTCHSLLNVSGGGMASTLPVTYVNESFGEDRSAWPYGLWVGEVSLTDVTFVGETNSVTAAASQPFDMRLILHHSTHGELRLLSRVVGVLVTNETGSAYRLYSDEKNLPAETESDVFRISSLAFGMMPPLKLTGSFLGSAPSKGSWTMDANDALNPYRHVFNNDLQKGFALSNEVTFTWMDGTNAPLLSGTAWKPNGYCAGEYEQRIFGLRHQEIQTRGMFRLEWVSGSGTLQ
ncbi:MAG: hypothetical protein EOL87_13865 [Spartobacteria bacterium]|nr:hypothetical protein [Spartobacteria bacterium]